MNREDIIRMAREALEQKVEYSVWTISTPHLEEFARLVAAAEREACCSAEVINAANIYGGDLPHQVVVKYQAAIRARGETK